VDVGQLISGRYRLVEQIGSGGMGVVWRARDEKLDQTVALKQAQLNSPTAQRRLRREARIAAGITHPNVVTFHEAVDGEGGELWLVMEYVPSQSLSELLDGGRTLSERQVRAIGMQLAGALEALHAQGIMHRDVKPGNVLITESGLVKLTDFGISRSVAGDETATETAAAGGTPGYLAPEVANGGDPTPASDVFSLGATLFAGVEGGSPFGGENPYVMLRRAAAAEMAAPKRADELAPALSSLMSPDPADRPTAAGARELLEAALPGTGDDTVPVMPLPPVRRRRRRILAAATVMAAVVVVAVVLVIVVPDRSVKTAAPPAAPAKTSSAVPVVPAKAELSTGDVRTADPCGLVDPAAFSSFGDSGVDPAYGNFDRCDVLVQRSGGRTIDVETQWVVPPAAGDTPQGTTTKSGSFPVVRGTLADGECDRTLVLPDKYLIAISAKESDSDSVDLCAVADVATSMASKVLDTKGIPRRSSPFPADSLAKLDACALLDTATLSHVSKVDAPTVSPGFGNWGCKWDSTDSDNAVFVVFDQGQPPASPDDGHQVKVSGHSAFVLTDDYAQDTCQARVVDRSFTNANGDQAAETVLVVVYGKGPSSGLCAPATQLAGAVAAKLPRT
jgi:tRNA A-37 threonylcarbamoyl transferase component Bud32